MTRVVLVTGVSQPMGRRFADALASSPGVDRVLGVDVRPPAAGEPEPATSPGVTFVRADIRSPAISKVLDQHEVDTVVHLGVVPPSSANRAVAKEANVIGSMQLLAACQRLPRVRKLVLRSTTAVYGASSHDPAMFSEDMEPRRMPTSQYGKDAIEVERYVRGFVRRRPDVLATVLRFSSLIGPRSDTPLTNYLTLPVVPTVLGFDARLQFTHEDDMIDALVLATTSELHGVVNVSGDGLLTLIQALRRLGRPTVPVPSFALRPFGRAVCRAAGVDKFDDEQTAFLTYGRGVDTTRMREDLKFEPAYTSAAAFQSFVESRETGPLSSDRVRSAEYGIAEALGVRLNDGAVQDRDRQ